jgi:hypothetical protein
MFEFEINKSPRSELAPAYVFRQKSVLSETLSFRFPSFTPDQDSGISQGCDYVTEMIGYCACLPSEIGQLFENRLLHRFEY